MRYPAFGVRQGYDYVRTAYGEGCIRFVLAARQELLVCPRCPSAQVKRKGRRFRELQTVPIGLKGVWLVTEVPQCECRACVRSARPSADRAGNGTANSACLSTPATARARVPAPGLAAMRDFHAWPGITGSAFFILHSAFFILHSAFVPPGALCSKPGGMGAVWGRYGGGAVLVWGHSHAGHGTIR